MSTSRRDFVRLAGAVTAGAMLTSPTLADASDPALGLMRVEGFGMVFSRA